MFMSSDSGHMQAAGMNDGALIGPGSFTSSVVDEHVEVSKLVASAKIYAATALKVCGYVE
jgi:acetylornithine deacetylase/succinyl-diaminopimelate desuccinylase-like protein